MFLFPTRIDDPNMIRTYYIYIYIYISDNIKLLNATPYTDIGNSESLAKWGTTISDCSKNVSNLICQCNFQIFYKNCFRVCSPCSKVQVTSADYLCQNP